MVVLFNIENDFDQSKCTHVNFFLMSQTTLYEFYYAELVKSESLRQFSLQHERSEEDLHHPEASPAVCSLPITMGHFFNVLRLFTTCSLQIK